MSDVKVRLVNVVKEFPSQEKSGQTRAVDGISFDIYDGEFFAMLGPSGCGKTTTLRMIAGFEQPTSGEIILDGVPMQGVPAFQRPVNTVFQDYVLFPHMTVLQNVMFGLQMAKVPQAEARRRAQDALDLVRLPKVAERKPRELSGGQQQRVALARALVNRPSVLLLDEPLGALDLKLRREMQVELKAMQTELGITFVYVTHDQEEALTMADRIAVMAGGHVLQIGTPSAIYETPNSRFVADFIGETNFLEAQLVRRQGAEGIVALDDDTQVRVALPERGISDDQLVTLAIRPERLVIQPYNSAPPLPDGWEEVVGHVGQVQYIGTDMRYYVRIGGHHVRVRAQNATAATAHLIREREVVRLRWQRDNARLLIQ
ncbi:ABC transporter ATP-binding protein (plasmid) [Aggregatilineales bacterium SYSU G02658]